MRALCSPLSFVIALITVITAATAQESEDAVMEFLHQTPVVVDQHRLLAFPLPLHRGCHYTLAGWVWIWRSPRMSHAEQAVWSTTAVQATSMLDDVPRLQPAVLLNVAPHPDRLFFSMKLGDGNLHQGFFAKQDFRHNEWMHLAVTMTGTHMQAYVNGELQGTLPLSQFAMFHDEEICSRVEEGSENVLLQLGTLHRGHGLPSILQHTFYSNSELSEAEIKHLMEDFPPLPISTQVLEHLDIPHAQRHTTPMPSHGNPWLERKLGVCPARVCGPLCLDDTRRAGRATSSPPGGTMQLPPHTGAWAAECRDRAYQLGQEIMNSPQHSHLDHLDRLERSHPYFMLSVLCADDAGTATAGQAHMPAEAAPATAVLAFRHHLDVDAGINWDLQPWNFEHLAELAAFDGDLPGLSPEEFEANDDSYDDDNQEANENFKGGEFAVSGLSDSDCEIAATYYYSLAQYTSAQYGRPGVGHVDQVLLREDDFEGFGGEEDDAVQYHQQEADNGDVPSQLWLGKRYFWGGGGIQPDPVRAQQYFDRAAQQGNPEAQYNLGVMLMSGDTAPPDPAASLNYFEQAAAAGFAPAQNGLASQYLSGRGAVAQNLTRAFEYFSRAAANGSADGHYGLAVMYKDGLGVEQNVPAAVKHLTAAAQAYHVRALAMLGSAIYDEQSWLATYRRAALNTLSVLFDVDELIDMEIDGGADGERLVGDNGDGQSNAVPLLHRSCQTALPLLKAAADVGPWIVDPVRHGLELYLDGDLKESLRSYQRAADAGVAMAQDNAAFLHDALARRECWWLRGEQKEDYVRSHKSAAIRRNVQLANAGDARALRVLGDELSKGKWLPRDMVAGFRAYAAAAELGDDEALFNVARAFHTGTGTEKNLTIARRLYNALLDFELEDFSLMQVYSAQGLDVAPAGTYGVAPALMLGLLRFEEWWSSWQSWYHANQTAAGTAPHPTTATGRGGGKGGGVRLDMESMLLSCCVATFVMLGVYRLARRRRQAMFAQRLTARRA